MQLAVILQSVQTPFRCVRRESDPSQSRNLSAEPRIVSYRLPRCQCAQGDAAYRDNVLTRRNRPSRKGRKGPSSHSPRQDGTSVSLTHHHTNDVNYYDATINNSDNINPLEKFYLITEQKWHKDTLVPISLLPSTKGMPTRSHHRIRQSVTGLDDAGMDLQVAQLNSQTDKEVHSRTTLSWLDWHLPYFVALCAIAGTILFTFLILLWLRKQMSREKDNENGDRHGLVEEGATCKPDKSTKDAKEFVEAKWVQEAFAKQSAPKYPVRPVPQTSLPESLATPERKPEAIRMKAKGLLERRGSSTSLTIELAPAPESPPHMVTPTRECTTEEFLLSAGNVLSRAQLKKVIESTGTLHKEFWEVPLNLPEKVNICGSGVKNRYSSVLPNLQTRVTLPGSSDDPLTGYINANYIRGYDGENARYIATQGPLANTIADFWKMIWTEKVPAIVMITRLYEASKPKCEAYFPFDVNNRLQAGSFTVIVNYIDTRNGYTVRTMEIRHEGERRHLQHYWYDSWPDHAVPQTADALVSMAAEVNALPRPVVVHCSAGIGRTGCFIAIGIGMNQLIKDGNVDVLGILCQMRYDRGGMVQTAEQYEFIHRALYLFEQTLDKPSTSSD
ncbi:PREDICTED: LOW QUALITY PROTEIN: tyrosine-protein phosphatase non-receptor type 5-like [Cyphomyrmex costatus]|uniref:LOW QUALITY PROTEIN: tyrosine-protein phosphatase non-receptor type 5-like n=1 Tax=Cyphomyrmex costatus TaxID=456900 RepID=UPI0008523557|nr:PREDICTED: LOW QUALITY PROTEIN: tyrosine-protein phosphatase non-receptor type 5-like [Cyphomyrmex costatus]